MRAALSRTFAIVFTLVLVAAGAPALAVPQEKYPNKPIRVVVPSSAGGAVDILARMIAPKLSHAWNQPVIVDNRVSAGGTIGAAIVAKADPDGHTLLLTSSAFPIAAVLMPNLPYDTLKDFAGVADLGASTLVAVVAPSLGVRSMTELGAYAKTQPGKLLFGSAGAGSATHLHAELFMHAAGLKARHVGFKGQSEFVIEIAAGRIHFGVCALTVCLPFITQGRVLALATSEPSRLLSGVPEMAVVAPRWQRSGAIRLLAPAGTPRAVLSQLSKEVARILDLPDVRKRLDAVAFHIVPTTPADTDKGLRADIAIFTQIARITGLRAH